MKPRPKRKNPESINFGLRNRCINRAAKNALKENYESFSSERSLSDRWHIFSQWLNKTHDIKDMRNIGKHHLLEYGDHLLSRYEEGSLSASTAQNYLSAVNRILEIARRDKEVHVCPVKDCLIPKRSGVCKEDKSTSDGSHEKALSIVTRNIAILLEIQRNLGLRFEESAKIDAKKALKQALKSNQVNITEGTKGGQKRIIPITNNQQIQALEDAAEFQTGQSLIPNDQTYYEFRNVAYKEIAKTSINFHGERHHYAHQRYFELTGMKCPVKSGINKKSAFYYAMSKKIEISLLEAKSFDKNARKIISKELGHHRINITNAYLG